MVNIYQNSTFINDAAGDFGAGITGGLGTEIVRVVVENDGFPEYVGDGEPVGQHARIRAPAGEEQGRQVARVLRMG